MIERYRDLIIIYEGATAFVISCDSLGAIGNKADDVLKIDEGTIGRVTIKVAVAEALCLGARPIVVSNTLSTEMHPTGDRILKALKDELKENGIIGTLFTGSTEENFPTSMTGIGITVISRAKIPNLKIRKIKSGMCVSLLGYPLLGSEVIDARKALQLKDYMIISDSKEIIEAVPVGSKGIGYELGVLEKISGLKLIIDSPPSIDLLKSGGPSTSCIIVHNKRDLDIVNFIDKPLSYMGRLI